MPKPLLPVGTAIRVTVHVTPLEWQGCAYALVPGVCGTIEALPPYRRARRVFDGACDPASCTEYEYWIKFERHEIDAHEGPMDTSMWCLLCGHEVEPVESRRPLPAYQPETVHP
jgi:hypothetical protein